MVLPTAVVTCQVHGEFVNPDGTPAKGTVAFTPSGWVTDTIDDVLLPPAPVVLLLDDAGEFTAGLPVTPVDGSWFYDVAVAVPPTGLRFTTALPDLTSVEFSDLIPPQNSLGAAVPPVTIVPDNASHTSVITVTGVGQPYTVGVDTPPSTDIGNALVRGTDGRLFTPTVIGGGGVADPNTVISKTVVKTTGVDDTALLQAALNLGGWVHCPDPSYKLSAPVVFSVAGTRLSGGGWQGFTTFTPTAAMDHMFRVSANRCLLSDFTVNANSLAVSCLVMHNAARSRISEVEFENATQDGVRFDLDVVGPHGNNNIAKFLNCQSHGNGRHGFAVPVKQSDNNGIEFFSCEAHTNNDSGILHKGSGMRVFGGIYQANKRYGFILGEAADSGTTTGAHFWYPWTEANGIFKGSMSSTVNPTNLARGTGAIPFQATDVNRTVTVPGAGPAGVSLTGIVTAFVDANNLTLDTAASTTVTDVSCSSPQNGIYASTKSNSSFLWAPQGQQNVVYADGFGRVQQYNLGGNGEYDVYNRAQRGIRMYGSSGATAKAQILPASILASDVDMVLELLGKGALGVRVASALQPLGFFGAAGATKPTVSGTRADGAALASLLSALQAFGLITDTSTSGTAGSGPLFVRKTADEPVTSSAVPQNDDHLFLALTANTTYAVDLVLYYDGATTGDLALNFTLPAGTTAEWGLTGLISSTTASSGSVKMTDFSGQNSTGTIGAAGAGTKCCAKVRGLVRTAGTAGNLALQWAQAVSDVTATTVFTDSFLTAQAVA